MKPQTVLAVGAGYLLGRTKKMKLALTLAGVGAGKLASSNGDGLLQQGSDLLRSSPAFNELVGDVRGQLLEASKQAAASAARSQIDSMSERLLETRASGRDGESEDSDDSEDSEDSGARRQSSSSRSQSSSSGSQSSSSGARSSASKQASKKQSASKRPAGKKAAQKNSAKKRPANKRPANQERSGRSGSRSRSQKRSSSGSARRS